MKNNNAFVRSRKFRLTLFKASIMIYPLTLFAIFWIGGNLYNVLLAFQKYNVDGTTQWVGLANFFRFFADIGSGDNGLLLRISLRNTLISYAIRFLISNPLYFIFSFYLFKNFFGHKVLRAIMIIPQVLSIFIIALVFQKFVQGALPGFFKNLGILNFPRFFDPSYGFGTLIFFQIWISFAMSMILYPNAMRAIPGEIFECAKIDGVTFWKEFWHIIFPLIFPTISTLIITGIATLFTDGGVVVTFYMFGAPPEVYNTGYFFYTQIMQAKNLTGYPYLAAGGIILTLFSMPLTFLIKYLFDKWTPQVEY